MPKILINGQLVELTQEQYDAFTRPGSGQEVPAGGSTLQLNDNPLILQPNTASTIPGQTLSLREEILARNQELAARELGYGVPPDTGVPVADIVGTATVTGGVGYIPEDDFIGRVAVGQQPGFTTYPQPPVPPPAQDFELQVGEINLVDTDPNRDQNFVPYRGEVVEQFPYGGSAAAALAGPRSSSTTDDAGSSSYYSTPTPQVGPFIVSGPGNEDQGSSSYYPVRGNQGNPFAAAQNTIDDQGSSSYYPVQGQTGNPFAVRQTSGEPVTSSYYPTGAGAQGNPFANPSYTDDIAAKVTQLKQQNAIRSQRSAFNEKDWRVRLALAPQAQYLYNVAAPGDLLYPLLGKGVIFPYTPTINTAYRANYNTYDLTHSNIRGYFYQNSSPQEVQLTGTFTAQDTTEANYLLAVIHFLKSATKMFYGQDAQVGAPPPPLYLSGYGVYGFNEHPVLLSNFSYSLPNDVDYIRARSENINGTDLVVRRPRVPSPPNTSPVFSAISRLKTIFLPKGAEPKQKAAQPFNTSGQSLELGGETPTYVPTQMEIQLTLLPLQSRSQMSKQFSLTQFAQGSLLRGGFW